MLRIMVDPLFARSLLAIHESLFLREQRRRMSDQRDRALADLRYAILERASTRAEAKAHRDNKGEVPAFASGFTGDQTNMGE